MFTYVSFSILLQLSCVLIWLIHLFCFSVWKFSFFNSRTQLIFVECFLSFQFTGYLLWDWYTAPFIIGSVCAWAHTKSKVDGSCFSLSPCTLFLRQGLSFSLELTSQPIWDNELMGSTCLCPLTPALLLHGPQYLAVDLDAWDLEFIYHSFQAGTFCREPPSQPSRYILCLHFP